MKILAIIANLGWLIAFVYSLIKDGFPKTDEDAAIISLVGLTIILNLIVIIFYGKNQNWLSLYLKRKTLEEQKKIEKLSQKQDSKPN